MSERQTQMETSVLLYIRRGGGATRLCRDDTEHFGVRHIIPHRSTPNKKQRFTVDCENINLDALRRYSALTSQVAPCSRHPTTLCCVGTRWNSFCFASGEGPDVSSRKMWLMKVLKEMIHNLLASWSRVRVSVTDKAKSGSEVGLACGLYCSFIRSSLVHKLSFCSIQGCFFWTLCWRRTVSRKLSRTANIQNGPQTEENRKSGAKEKQTGS